MCWTLLGLCLVAQAPADALKNPLTIEQIARANSGAILAIRSLEVHGVYQQKIPKPRGTGVFKTTDEYTYTWRGSEERLRLDRVMIPPNPDGERLGLSDISNGPKGKVALIAYDPKSPPKLGEYTASAAVGYLDGQQSNKLVLGLNVKGQMLFEVIHGTQSWPLERLIATAGSAKIVAVPSSSPRACYELEVERPEAIFSISVDPAANFMMERVAFRPAAQSKVKAVGSLEVTRFQDCGDGVFVPVEVVGELTENAVTMNTRVNYEVLCCNTPLAQDAFGVAFPDWLPVLDQKNGKVYIWGPDNEPRLIFATYADYLRWHEPRFAKAKGLDRAVRNSTWTWVVSVSVGVLAVVALLMFKRWRPWAAGLTSAGDL